MTKTKKKSSAGKKIVFIVLIALTIFFLSRVLTKLYDMVSLQQQAALVEEQLEKIKDENASLISTKEKLEDPDYVQTYAMGEYMFSKNDEKVFYLP